MLACHFYVFPRSYWMYSYQIVCVFVFESFFIVLFAINSRECEFADCCTIHCRMWFCLLCQLKIVRLRFYIFILALFSSSTVWLSIYLSIYPSLDLFCARFPIFKRCFFLNFTFNFLSPSNIKDVFAASNWSWYQWFSVSKFAF